MTIDLFELQKLLEHAIPLTVVISLHLILDLPLEANGLKSTETLVSETRVGSCFLATLTVLCWLLIFDCWRFRLLLGRLLCRPLELGELVSLGFDPFAELDVFFVSGGNEAILYR